MSILSGIGQQPPVFSGGLAFDNPIVFTIPLFNNGSPNTTNTYPLVNVPLNLLENSTAYRFLFCYNVIPEIGCCQYINLVPTSNNIDLTITFAENLVIVARYNIPVDVSTTQGFLTIDGQFTTPSTSYNLFQFVIDDATIGYPPDNDLDLLTAGQIFFEALK